MAKKGNSSNKSSSLGGEHINEREANNISTGFSWNLDQKELNLEDNILLHKSIDFSCESLQKFKDGIWQELFIALDERFKRQEAINSLVDTTETQIDKNDANEINKRKIEKVIAKFESKRKEEISKKKGAELIHTLQEINNQEEEELAKIKLSLDNLEKAQTALRKQKKFLNVLTSNKVWETFLSMSEEAPRINFNIEWTPYKIVKWEKYEGKDWKSDIKNAIDQKVFESIEEDDLEDYADFIFKFILSPFDIEWKYDEKTIKYYVYSIIYCIENNDIVDRIWALCKKRKEVEERILDLRSNTDELTRNVEQLEYYLEEEKSKEHSRDSENIEENLLKSNISNLEDYTLIEYLRYLKYNPDEIWWELDISDKTVDKYKKIIDSWLKIWEEGVKNGISLTKNYIWKRVNAAKLNPREIVKLDEKTDFLNTFKSISEFIWKKEWTDECRLQAERLWYIMKEDFIGQRELIDNESDIDLLIYWELINKIEKMKKEIGKKDKGKIDSYLKEDIEKIQRAKSLYSQLKHNKQNKDENIRKTFINNCFQKILGIKFSASDLTNIPHRGTDKNLVGYMTRALIDNINKEREDCAKKEYAVLDNIYNIMLSRYWTEGHTSNKMDKNIENKIREDVTEKILDENTWTIEIDIYNSLIEEFNKIISDFSSELENSVNSADYDRIIENINRSNCKEELSTKIKEVKDINNILEWWTNWREVHLNDIPGEIPVEICRMIAIKRILEEKDLTLDDKFYYINILKKQNRPFCIECDEMDESVLKEIFGEWWVKLKVDEGKIENHEIIKNLKSKLMESDTYKYVIENERKFDKQAMIFCKAPNNVTALKTLLGLPRFGNQLESKRKNSFALDIGGTWWRILFIKGEDWRMYFDSFYPHDAYMTRMNKSKIL